jgi:hypothetical protein
MSAYIHTHHSGLLHRSAHHTYIHTYIHITVHAHTHTYILQWSHIHTYMHTYIHIIVVSFIDPPFIVNCTDGYIHTCTYTYIHIAVVSHTCIHTHHSGVLHRPTLQRKLHRRLRPTLPNRYMCEQRQLHKNCPLPECGV